MKQKRIRHIIEEKINTLSHIAADVSNNFDKDKIHEFRVMLKSLRAFLRLLKMHNNDKHIRISRKCKLLYDIAGAIREAQIELHDLDAAQNTIPSYLHHLKHAIEQQKEDWRMHYNEKVFTKLYKKLSHIKYKELPAAAAAIFAYKRENEAFSILEQKNATNNQIHTARKRIKDVLHLEKLATKEWKPASKCMQHIPLKTLNGLANAIGAYNDERIKLVHFKTFMRHMPNNEERKCMNALKAHEKIKMAAAKQEIQKHYMPL